MLELIQAIPFAFAAITPVLNPLGSAVIVLSMTEGVSEQEYRNLALKIAINTFILLAVVLLTGTWILRFFGISLPVVQIGGGMVIAYIGWTLLNKPVSGSVSNKVAIDSDDKNISEMAFFPLTMPVTAGPGTIAVAMTVGAHEMNNSISNVMLSEIGAVIGIVLVALTVFFTYRYANRVTAKLGPSGTQVITRLAAFINLCIGLEVIWHGVQGLLF